MMVPPTTSPQGRASFLGRRAGLLSYGLALVVLLGALAAGEGAELLGLYTFEDTTDDVSGAGAHPTNSGGNVGGFVSGFEGKALEFTGSGGDGLAVPIDIQSGNSVTVGGWVSLDSTGSEAIFGTDNGGWDRGLIVRGGTLYMHGDQNLGVSAGATGSSSWHFFAATFDASNNAKFYYDSDTPVWSGTVNSGGVNYLNLGDYDQIGIDNHPLDGRLDNLFVMDDVLSDTEIATIRSTGVAGIAQVGGLPEPPAIVSFVATPPNVSAGTPVTLSWVVDDPLGETPQLAITPLGGDVTGQSSIQVTPTETTTFTLVAANSSGSSSAQTTVTVDEPPVINSFTAANSTIHLGESTVLSWEVGGATTLAIDQGGGNVTALSNLTVTPTATTTYTLTASNSTGNVTAQVTVEVDRTPWIRSFTVDQTNVEAGTEISLSWVVSNADSLSIDQGIGVVTGQTTVTDTPASTRTYTLTASNLDGSSTATVSVIAGETLTISEFLAINDSGLTDEDGTKSDWIEIHNPTAGALSLDGWYLTDDPASLTKWRFPAVSLPAGGYVVVFASDKNRAVAGSELHTNFKLSGDGEYLALVRPDGTSISRHYAPVFPNQTADVSYGLYGVEQSEGYFEPPTPGAANGTGFEGFVADTQFSVDRGFYDTPIQVAVTTATAGAQIRYTLDGSEPSATSGTLYTGPIAISATTVLRALAYKTGFRSSNIDTQTYLYTADIKTQPEMDPEVLGVSPYNASIENDLKSLPTLSLVLPNASLFGSNGIYSNSNNRGIAWERAVSVEFFTADKSEEFQVDAGIRIHGADARTHPKKPFKLYFRSQYGPGKLRYPLFPGKVAEFDKLVLRGGGHEAWSSVHGSGSGAQAHSATYLRDQFLRQVHGEMGHLSPRGRHCHLYLNGTYWGLYIVHERVDEEFGEAHLGGSEDDYDVIKTQGAVVDGTKADWNAMQALANGGLSGNSAYQQMLGYLDIDSFIDNMIIRIWAGDIDWLRSQNELSHTGNRNKNWYALRNTRGAQQGKWQFFVWDTELSMGKSHGSNRNTHFNVTDVDISDSPGRIYTRLRDNAEFRLRFADRLRKHFFHAGALTPSVNQARWLALSDKISDAVVAESARWGDAIRSTPYTKNQEWRSEMFWLSNTFMAGRTATVLNQFKAINLYPGFEPPEFLVGGVLQHGGAIGSSQIGFAPVPSGQIYYTTDGSDPRVEFSGAVAPSAQLYSGPFSLPSSRLVRVRVRDGTNWSAINEAAFLPGPLADGNNLVVSEIHYQSLPPAGAGELAVGSSRGDFEYIELMNAGGTTIDLGLVSFGAGIDYSFPLGTTLPSGGRVVLASNAAAFTARYGIVPDGVFTGSLDDSGETITLRGADGSTVIRTFAYDDDFPWPESADGEGYSLVLIAPGTNPNHGEPRNWRPSVSIGGTPGGTDAAPLAGSPNGDDNGNGMSNLLEHALGGTTLPAIGVQTFEVGGTPEEHLAFTMRRNLAADDVLSTVETSQDLLSWQPLSSSLLSSSINNGDGTVTEVWRAIPMPPSEVRSFVRLKVEVR